MWEQAYHSSTKVSLFSIPVNCWRVPCFLPRFCSSPFHDWFIIFDTEALLRGSTAFLTYTGSTGRFLIKRELRAMSSPPPLLPFYPAQLRNNMFFFSVPSFYLLLFSCFPVIFYPSCHGSGAECWWALAPFNPRHFFQCMYFFFPLSKC